MHCLRTDVSLDAIFDGSMEQVQLSVVSIHDLVHDARIFFPEAAVLELGVGDCLPFYFFFAALCPVESVWVLNHDIEPDAWLNLLEHMCEGARRDALNRCLCLRERQEKVDYTLRNTHLLALLVDVGTWWVEVHDFDICELILGRLFALGSLRRVDNEDGANLDLAQHFLGRL